MIGYPSLERNVTIGVTTLSPDVSEKHHSLFELALRRMEGKSFQVVIGKMFWTQDKEKLGLARERADEFSQTVQDENIQMILPIWGGELLIKILDSVDFDALQPKWTVGYSSISTLLFVVTLRTRIATAHGTSLVDLRGEYPDETTVMQGSVLKTRGGEPILQQPSERY